MSAKLLAIQCLKTFGAKDALKDCAANAKGLARGSAILAFGHVGDSQEDLDFVYELRRSDPRVLYPSEEEGDDTTLSVKLKHATRHIGQRIEDAAPNWII